MYVVLGTTHKGEVFAIGYTSSRQKAEKFAATVDGFEYLYVDIQLAGRIA